MTPLPPEPDWGGTGALAEPGERERRVLLLAGPAFAALEAYRGTIAARFGPTPHPDPLDGGATARLLLLLETPGPRGAEPRFVSRDNPTGTARNLRRFLRDAGLDRRQTVLWNVVPWTIHAEGARNRAPRRAEIEAGLSLLPGFLALLPGLRVVVAAGRTAARAAPLLQDARPELAVLEMPHPSPTYVNTSPAVALRIADTLGRASAMLAEAPLNAQHPPRH